MPAHLLGDVGADWIRDEPQHLKEANRLFVQPVVATLDLKLSRLALPGDNKPRAICVRSLLRDFTPPTGRPYVFVEQIALIARGARKRVWKIELGSDLHHVKTKLGRIPGAPILNFDVQSGIGSILKRLALKGQARNRSAVELCFELIE